MFGLIFSPCFHHSNLVWVEWEWWKPKTIKCCFLFLSYITQWHQGKFSDSVGPISLVLSSQFKVAIWYYCCSLKNHFSLPSKYFSQNFPPFHFPLSVFSHISLLHQISASSDLNWSTKWVWSHFSSLGSELKWVWSHFSVRCKNHLKAFLWSSPRCGVYLSLPLYCQWPLYDLGIVV